MSTGGTAALCIYGASLHETDVEFEHDAFAYLPCYPCIPAKYTRKWAVTTRLQIGQVRSCSSLPNVSAHDAHTRWPQGQSAVSFSSSRQTGHRSSSACRNCANRVCTRCRAACNSASKGTSSSSVMSAIAPTDARAISASRWARAIPRRACSSSLSALRLTSATSRSASSRAVAMANEMAA
eukprot:scaffold248419_cov28-Tisochrysis_lutea.AAC.9